MLQAQLVSITARDHKFLDHDSLMDCTELLGGFTGSDLEDLYAKDSSVLIGVLSHHVCRTARKVIRESPLLSKAERDALLVLW